MAADEVEVTEHGEIVARCAIGEAWTEPDALGIWVNTEDTGYPRNRASALLTREDMAAWCRRVLREVDTEAVPTVDEVMAAWGIDDLRISIDGEGVCVTSSTVGELERDLLRAGVDVPRRPDRYAGLIGAGSTHAEALRNALVNAAGPWGDLP